MDNDIRPAKKPLGSEPEETPDMVIDEAAWDKENKPEPASSPAPETTPDAGATGPSKPKKASRWKETMKLHWPPGKKEWITFLVIALVIGGGIAAYVITHNKPATLRPIPKVTATTKTVPSILTGLPVDPIVNQRTVTAVMIENSTQARPQAGLSQAGVVFEAIAEAGITRFLALYQDTAPDNVGPIRSARPYYVQWELGFDAGYAHVGGSPDALADIAAWNVRDLNQFYNGASYHRVNSRPAPHNVYTSIGALNQLEVSKGYVTSHYTGFARTKKAFRKKSQPITAKNISLALSGPTYNVLYNYDVQSNRYFRSEGGAAQTDTNTNQQITPVVVIALVMPYSLEADGYHSNYGVIGSGAAYIFQNGGVITGQWTKTDNTSQIKFTDAAGQAIPLNPGQTWITAVGNASQITYTP